MEKKWIKYSEKIPEEKQDCWICQHDDTVTRAEYINFHEIFGAGFGSYDEFIKEKYVKCWMKYYTPNPPCE